MKWETRALGEVIVETRNGLYKHDSFYGRGTPILKMFNIGRLDGQWVLDRVDRVELSNRETDDYTLQSGDLLVNRVNSRELVGKCALVDERTAGHVYESKNMRVRLNRDVVLPDWISLWMNGPDGRAKIEEKTKQIAGMATINKEDVLSLVVPLPKLAEQRRIAARLREQLAEVAQARTALQSQLEAAEKLRAAALRECFDEQATAHGERIILGSIAEIASGLQKMPDRAPRAFHRPFLTVRNVQRGFLDLSRVERFELTLAELERLRLQRGDLLIVEGNGSKEHIGRNALFDQDDEWIHQNHIIRVRLDRERCLPEFVSNYLNSRAGREQMLEKAETTTGLYTLSSSKVASLQVPCPTIKEQHRIVAELDALQGPTQTLTANIRARLEAVEKLPAALLREVFACHVA